MGEELKAEYDDLVERHLNLGKLLEVMMMIWRDQMARIKMLGSKLGYGESG